MFSIRNLLLGHGYLFLFSYLLGVAAGVPLPADPLLLIMGALIGDHLYSVVPALLVSVAGLLIGDLIWYELGRRRGRSILAVLCKLSLEPDTCVRKAETSFSKRGDRALLFAKFVPGMGLIAMPMSGVTGMSRGRFLLFDSAAALLWSATYLSIGILFHKQVNVAIVFLGLLGRRAGLVVCGLIAGYIGFKFFQRWRFLRQLRVNRITPEAVRKMLAASEPVTIVDLRHPAEVERDAIKIAGALVLRPDELRSRSGEIPREHEIILYCT